MSCEDRGDTPSVCLQGTPLPPRGGPNQYHTETGGGER